MPTHAVLTGPIIGSVTCADGTQYDVDDPVIYVASHEHAKEVAHLIGARHNNDPNSPHSHVCDEHCPSREG